MLKGSKKSYFSSQNFIIFLILLLFSISSYVVKGEFKLGTVRNIASVLLYPSQKVITSTKNLFSVYRDNKVLRRKIAMISLEIQRCKNMKKENIILRELFGFKPILNFNLIPGEIIGKNPGLYNKIFIIDSGLKNGVKKKLPVIVAKGLVGKIIESTSNTSQVLTLYNRNSYVSVTDLRSRVHGIIKWQGGKFLILDDVSLHSDIKFGDTLITSGLGGVFPKGIFVGSVIKVSENPRKIVMQIDVKPFVDYSLLENVFVIVESKISHLIPYSKKDTLSVLLIHFDLFVNIEKPKGFSEVFMSRSKNFFHCSPEVIQQFFLNKEILNETLVK